MRYSEKKPEHVQLAGSRPITVAREEIKCSIFSINGNNSFLVLCFVLLQLFHDNVWNIFMHLLQGFDDSVD